MQRHERDRVGVGVERVDVGDERGTLQKVIEGAKANLSQLIGDLLGGAGDELLYVVETVGGFGSFGLQVVFVFDCVDNFTQQLVDGRLLRRRSQSLDERKKLCERRTCRRTKTREEVRA